MPITKYKDRTFTFHSPSIPTTRMLVSQLRFEVLKKCTTLGGRVESLNALRAFRKKRRSPHAQERIPSLRQSSLKT